MTLPSSLGARADYGIAPWIYTNQDRRTRACGDAGFNAFPVGGRLNCLLRLIEGGEESLLDVRVDGYPAGRVRVDSAGRLVTLTPRRSGMFVELVSVSSREAPFEIVVLDYPARRGR